MCMVVSVQCLSIRKWVGGFTTVLKVEYFRALSSDITGHRVCFLVMFMSPIEPMAGLSRGPDSHVERILIRYRPSCLFLILQRVPLYASF